MDDAAVVNRGDSRTCPPATVFTTSGVGRPNDGCTSPAAGPSRGQRRVSNLPEVESMGNQSAQNAVLTPSDFAFPRDGIASEASPNSETVVMAELDLEVLRRNRRGDSVRQLQDRRKGLHQGLMRDGVPSPVLARGETVPKAPSAVHR